MPNPYHIYVLIGRVRGMGTFIEQQFFRVEPYLRKAIQNVARELHPSFVAQMHAGEDGLKEKEFWIAIYGLPVVHK